MTEKVQYYPHFLAKRKEEAKARRKKEQERER
jgi:hypothetical protein